MEPRLRSYLGEFGAAFSAIHVDCASTTCRLLLEHSSRLTVWEDRSLMGVVERRYSSSSRPTREPSGRSSASPPTIRSWRPPASRCSSAGRQAERPHEAPPAPADHGVRPSTRSRCRKGRHLVLRVGVGSGAVVRFVRASRGSVPLYSGLAADRMIGARSPQERS